MQPLWLNRQQMKSRAAAAACLWRRSFSPEHQSVQPRAACAKVPILLFEKITCSISQRCSRRAPRTSARNSHLCEFLNQVQQLSTCTKRFFMKWVVKLHRPQKDSHRKVSELPSTAVLTILCELFAFCFLHVFKKSKGTFHCTAIMLSTSSPLPRKSGFISHIPVFKPSADVNPKTAAGVLRSDMQSSVIHGWGQSLETPRDSWSRAGPNKT